MATAARQGADLAVFPEATQARFGSDLRAVAEPLDGAFGAGLADMARGAVFMKKLAALRTDRDRIRALPPDAPQVVITPTGLTIGEYWATPETQSRRRFLLDAGYCVHAASGQQAYMVVDEAECARAAESL